MSPVASCGGCPRKWTSMTAAHCVSCHLQFADVAAFDRHRSRGKCVKPRAPKFRRLMDIEGGRLWTLR